VESPRVITICCIDSSRPHKMEDNLNLFKNGRWTQFFKNGRHPQIYFGKWKTTLINGKQKTTNIFLIESKILKMEDNLNNEKWPKNQQLYIIMGLYNMQAGVELCQAHAKFALLAWHAWIFNLPDFEVK
jgi:hypothetical protein